MKRIIVFLFILNLSMIVSAQDWGEVYEYEESFSFEKTFKIIKDTNIYTKRQEIIDTVKKGQVIKSKQFAIIEDNKSDNLDIVDNMIGYEDGWISVDDVVLLDSDVFSDSMINNRNYFLDRKWVPVWYNTIARGDKKLEDFSNWYLRYKDVEEIPIVNIHTIEIRNTYLMFFDTNRNICFSILNIQKMNNVYYVSCELEDYEQKHYYALADESFSNLPNLPDNRCVTFIIEQNGNRMRFYNGENYSLIIELMQVNKIWRDSMLSFVESDYKMKPSNLTPKEENLDHPWSDPVTGFYEGSSEDTLNWPAISSVNLTPNQLMSVSENLKLRSTEATTSEVLTVMAAGTKVKILELGHSETIDGITSNWVKVELLAGATDRDGNPIEKGTTGWCYGGYLEEAEEVLSDNQPNQEPAPIEKQSSNLLLIAILVSVGILLILVIILIILKKRNKKEDL